MFKGQRGRNVKKNTSVLIPWHVVHSTTTYTHTHKHTHTQTQLSLFMYQHVMLSVTYKGSNPSHNHKLLSPQWKIYTQSNTWEWANRQLMSELSPERKEGEKKRRWQLGTRRHILDLTRPSHFTCFTSPRGVHKSIVIVWSFMRLLKLHKLVVGKLDLSRGGVTCHGVLDHGLIYATISL